MELVGVAEVATDWRVQTAIGKGLDLYAATTEGERTMRNQGIVPAGELVDPLGRADAVVDTTPRGVAARNLARYRELGVKAILQGGGAHAATGHFLRAGEIRMGPGPGPHTSRPATPAA